MKKIVLMGLFALSFGFAFAQPSGSITAFAGPKNKIPKGWVLCDGTLFDRTKSVYATLFNAIGVSWGGDGGNKFAVPDLRGQFLRGVSDASDVDPDKDSRGKSRLDLNSSGNGGNAVGSKEKDELKSHDHIIGGRDQTGTGCNSTLSGCGEANVQRSTSTTGGKETRPVNAYVYYIIKL